MNEEQQFKRLATKVKIRRWLMTAVIAVVVMVIGGGSFVGYTKIASQKASTALNKYFDITHEILAPNIQYSDQYLANTSFFGGTLVSHQYKEIEGYRETWSPERANYSWTRGVQLPDMLNSADSNQQRTALYDRETTHKIPMFFNLKTVSPNIKPTQELKKVTAVKGHVAEIALTFKQPLTYRQIQDKLPANLHAVWYWIGISGHSDATLVDNNYLGVQGSQTGKLNAAKYRYFHKMLLAAKDKEGGYGDTFAYAGRYAKSHATLAQAKFTGVIVTGNSEAFKALKEANWIAASSVGYFQARTAIK